jgi:hypothetical protein
VVFLRLKTSNAYKYKNVFKDGILDSRLSERLELERAHNVAAMKGKFIALHVPFLKQ